MEQFDIYIIADGILGAVLLFFAAGLAEKLKSPKWRILYAVPFILCTVLAAISGFDACMIPAYAGTLILVVGLVKDNVKVRRAVCTAAVVLCAAAVPLCTESGSYRVFDYSRDFEKGFSDMKEHYVLSRQKNIDWDAIYAKYLPRFKEAQDDIDAYILWSEYCAEFHDGHVGYVPADLSSEDDAEFLSKQVFDRLGANDYGLSMLTMSDGSAAAVNVDESLNSLGIFNGTVILSWDGMTIEEAAEKAPIKRIMNFADKDNERFYLPAAAASLGGDSVKVTFLGENGEEKTAELPRLGGYYPRYKKAKSAVENGVAAANFAWTEIDENTGCLRIKGMTYDSDSTKTNNFDALKRELSIGIDTLISEGKSNLVIDIRSNSGGSGLLVKALGELLAPTGTHFYCCDGTWDSSTGTYIYNEETGTYPIAAENTFIGENKWQGNPIIILVNADSVSAADHLCKIMSGMENVTIMGFTEPNGSAQGVTSCTLEKGLLGYSGSLILNRDGSVFIDSGTDYESGDDIDIRVPFDKEAIRALYENGEDYLMDKALERFAQMN